MGLPAALVASHRSIARARPKVGRSKKRAVRPTATKVDAATLRRAKTHVLRPKHVAVARSDKGVSARARRITRLGKLELRPIDIPPRLDVAKFGPALHAALETSVTGYVWQLRKDGVPVATGQWQWSKTPTDGGQGWSLDTRMHVASVSKLLTAMATLSVLDGRIEDVDSRIDDYLPDYWTRGPATDKLTFRHLLTHRSGFSTGSSYSDYGFMKSQFAAGVAGKLGSYDYENMNFGLCRILIPVLWGWINPADTHGSATDTTWDIRTTNRFLEYCQKYVFGPAGVSGVGFEPVGTRALAYTFPHGTTSGWNSGDLTTVSGGAGFRMSINELLAVMGTFRRSGTILSQSAAQNFLDSMLGIDQVIDTPAGKLYNKNGAWGDGIGRTEQAVAYFMPENMEMAIFVNSKISGNKSLRGLVRDTYVASLV